LKFSREFKTGIASILVIAIFVWGFNYLKGKNLFAGTSDTYTTSYPDVSGLSTSSPVTINGVIVGQVTSINFSKNPEKKGWLDVEFRLNKKFEFSKQSEVKLYSDGIIGEKMIAILPSYEGALAEPGDFLKGKVESDIFSSITNQLNPLQGIVEGLVKKLDKTVSGLNEVLDTESQKNLKNSFTNLNATIANFQAISSDVDKLISSNNQKFSKIISNLESGSNTFKNLSNELEKADLSSVVADIKGSLDSLNSTLSKLDSGKGTTGKLMNDEELYQNLTNASKELEELLREVKTNPKKFVHFSVFGKKQKQVD